MKKYLLSTALLISSFIAFGQTNAPNFTAADCNGLSHTLYDKLDSGKIVVLVWVMPCSYCISDAIAAYDAVQSFSTSNPGEVLYYLVDDFGQTSCTSLSSWANNNGIPSKNISIFKNAGVPIDENAYGGSGMPHVVVIGGSDHKIYLNIKNSSNNYTVIQNAITEALAGTTATKDLGTDLLDVVIKPNIIKDRLTFEYVLNNASDVKIRITDLAGVVLKTLSYAKQNTGKYSNVIDINAPEGMYLLQLQAGDKTKVVKFSIAH